MIMTKTTYVTIRIDYEYNGEVNYGDENEICAMAADLVVERALAHSHTIENGIIIDNIENCGVNM